MCKSRREFIERDTVCVVHIEHWRSAHNSHLERDRIERCLTKLGMMIVDAWAGGQLPVVSGTGVTIGEDLFEGHSWTMGVVLLVTVGVGLHSCVCCIQSAPAN